MFALNYVHLLNDFQYIKCSLKKILKLYFKVFLKDFTYLFQELEEGRETERERNNHMKEKHLSVTSPARTDQGRTCNLDMFPDWESNW